MADSLGPQTCAVNAGSALTPVAAGVPPALELGILPTGPGNENTLRSMTFEDLLAAEALCLPNVLA